MKDNADPRRIHSAVCMTVQMTLAAQASSAVKPYDGLESSDETAAVTVKRNNCAGERTNLAKKDVLVV